MTVDLGGRSFLKLDDFTPEEIRYLLDLAAELKAEKAEGRERARLSGRNIALIFEKTSTRTRCSFEVASYDQGGCVTYLGPSSGSQIGHKESIKDTARVVGRMYDGIQYRGFGQAIIEELDEYAGVPVWNGLTDEYHPTQVLCDLLTMAASAKESNSAWFEELLEVQKLRELALAAQLVDEQTFTSIQEWTKVSTKIAMELGDQPEDWSKTEELAANFQAIVIATDELRQQLNILISD